MAEVLITLAIIGVVAALTIPTLIAKHQKQVTVTRLKHFYSLMSQAFEMSKAEHGDYDMWTSNNFGLSLPDEEHPDVSVAGDGKKQLEWLKEYLLPYIKYTEASYEKKYAIVGLANGSGFTNYNSLYFFCIKYSDCKEKLETWNSRDRFIFFLDRKKGFQTFGAGNTREQLTSKSPDGYHACNKVYTGYCSGLIQYDGWKIKDDYPW